MQATITLSTTRATPYAIEYIDAKDLKKVPKEFASARAKWEAGDHSGAKGILLQFLGGAIGEPLCGGDDLSETDTNDLEPTFDLREVWWTKNPIPRCGGRDEGDDLAEVGRDRQVGDKGDHGDRRGQPLDLRTGRQYPVEVREQDLGS